MTRRHFGLVVSGIKPTTAFMAHNMGVHIERARENVFTVTATSQELSRLWPLRGWR